jgi:hypothetical protein
LHEAVDELKSKASGMVIHLAFRVSRTRFEKLPHELKKRIQLNLNQNDVWE